MGRLRRFPGHRYVGRRDLMEVFDLDDDAQFAELALAVEGRSLVDTNQLSAFAPDVLAEARNRGFRLRRRR